MTKTVAAGDPQQGGDDAAEDVARPHCQKGTRTEEVGIKGEEGQGRQEEEVTPKWCEAPLSEAWECLE